MEERNHIVKELEKKDFTHESASRAFRFWDVIHTDTGGYTENDFTIHLFSTGDITISRNDSDDFICLEGQTAKTFRKLIGLGDMELL